MWKYAPLKSVIETKVEIHPFQAQFMCHQKLHIEAGIFDSLLGEELGPFFKDFKDGGHALSRCAKVVNNLGMSCGDL